MGERDAKVFVNRILPLHGFLNKLFGDAQERGVEVIFETAPDGDIIRRIRYNGQIAEERTTNLGTTTFTVFDTAIFPNNEREKYIIEEEATGHTVGNSGNQEISYYVTSYRRQGGKMEPYQAGTAACDQMHWAIKATRRGIGLKISKTN